MEDALEHELQESLNLHVGADNPMREQAEIISRAMAACSTKFVEAGLSPDAALKMTGMLFLQAGLIFSKGG